MKNEKEDSLEKIKEIATFNGLRFEHHPNAYECDVFSCEEAANARGISIEQELKHILVENSKGLCIVHLPANKFVSLRKVKRFFKIKDSCLADLSKFNGVKYGKGTICPFIEPFWDMKHLIDESLFNCKWMATNDGTLRGYVIFDPKILLKSRENTVGDFGKD